MIRLEMLEIIMKRSCKKIILLLVLFLVTACNFPLKLNALRAAPYATLDPSIFEAHTTPGVDSTQYPPAAELSIPDSTPVVNESSIIYSAQSGDTLNVVASHFNVAPDQISSPAFIPARDLIEPGQTLVIPLTSENIKFMPPILPDGAVIDSPCAKDFNLFDFVSRAGGYLSFYQQKVGAETLSGTEVVRRVADNNSVNPRLLLALIEFRSGWVFRYEPNPDTIHPLGLNIANYEGLYLELSAAARMINTGYYAWREGKISEITFTDHQSNPIAPNLNAGSVGIEYLLAQLIPSNALHLALYGEGGFIPLYQSMFGDAWECARSVEPLFPGGLQPPKLELPFAAGETWALTGGLHTDWNNGTPIGALDFAPVTGEPVCAVSKAWVRAPAAGVISRSGNGMVILDLVDETDQFTGWQIVFLHVAALERAPVGSRLNLDDPVGHPSCEGGASTGTHVHITRKYRGEWIGADEPFQFILSGYRAVPGDASFQGVLVNGARIVTPRQDARSDSIISR